MQMCYFAHVSSRKLTCDGGQLFQETFKPKITIAENGAKSGFGKWILIQNNSVAGIFALNSNFSPFSWGKRK